MSNLAHWNYIDNFTAFEAASLILGLEPKDLDNDDSRVSVVVDRMRFDYDNTFNRLVSEYCLSDSDNIYESEPRWTVGFRSVKMEELEGSYINHEDESIFNWFKEKEENQFNKQNFSRYEICSWLKKIKRNSVYEFIATEKEVESIAISDIAVLESNKKWPWGNHNTVNLDHLAAAGKKFWARYDPTDSTTAPTNVVVSNWLQKERNASKPLANSIASILRDESLSPGPRKVA